VVVPVDGGGRNDASDGVGVVDEVLSKRFARPEINLSGQVSYLGSAE
jgi:hypothetical protein